MTEYDNTNRGVLFKNNRKESDKHADYTGNINVGGEEFWLSAWVKEGKNGKFFSLSIKKKAPAADWVDDGPGKAKVVTQEQSISQRAMPKRDPISSGRNDDLNDDVPF